MSVHELDCFTFLLFCDSGETTSVRNGGAFNDCNNRNHHFQSESQITISNPNPNHRSPFSIQIAIHHFQSESQITIFPIPLQQQYCSIPLHCKISNSDKSEISYVRPDNCELNSINLIKVSPDLDSFYTSSIRA